MSYKKRQKIISKNKGQSLFEFLLLFAMIIGFSIAVLRLTNRQLSNYWLVLGNRVLGPTPNPADNPRVNRINLR